MSLRVIWQYTDRSIYCHMTFSAMHYLLYIYVRSIVFATVSIKSWTCSDSMTFFVFNFIITVYFFFIFLVPLYQLSEYVLYNNKCLPLQSIRFCQLCFGEFINLSLSIQPVYLLASEHERGSDYQHYLNKLNI